MTVRPIDLSGQNVLKGEVERMKRELPELIAYQQLRAQLTKAHFDALVSQGFSAEQALELCK